MSPKLKVALMSGMMLLATALSAPAALAQSTGSSGSSSSTSTGSSGSSSSGSFAENDANVCTDWQIKNGFCKSNARKVFQIILNFALGFLSLIATSFLVYGGFLYVTAGASKDNVDKAKNIIVYSAMGILLIFLSWAIIATLLNIGNNPTP